MVGAINSTGQSRWQPEERDVYMICKITMGTAMVSGGTAGLIPIMAQLPLPTVEQAKALDNLGATGVLGFICIVCLVVTWSIVK